MDRPDDPVSPERLAEVRRELARLGTDADSAPAVPAEVSARIGAALRAAPSPRAGGSAAHSVRRSVPRLRRLQLAGAVAGGCAALVAVGLGALVLARPPAPTRPASPTAELITVSRPPRAIPLTDAQLLELLADRPDYGPLADAGRRASCLGGLGYPATAAVLGARPLDIDGRPGVLLLLPGGTPATVVALVVRPDCSAANTGLLAETTVRRP